jgi:hypothetical protein
MRTKLIIATAGLLFAGCSSSSTPTRTVSGRVASTGFPTAVKTVKVLQGSRVVAIGPVGADGQFSLAVPLASNLSMRFVGAGYAALAIPRAGGTIEHTFALGQGRDINLGTIHFVGNASTTGTAYHMASSGDCDDQGEDEGEDQYSPGVCVDDPNDNDTCDGMDPTPPSTCNDDDNSQGDNNNQGCDDNAQGDEDGPDDGDCMPAHDPPQGCDGTGSGSTGSGGGSGTGSGGGTGSGSGSGSGVIS